MKLSTYLFSFFGVSTALLIVLETFIGGEIHILSLAAQVLGLIFVGGMIWAYQKVNYPRVESETNREDKEELHSYFKGLKDAFVKPIRVIESVYQQDRWVLVTSIVLLNAVLGIITLFFLNERLSFVAINEYQETFNSVFLISGTVNVLIAQVGGWPLQAFLTFMVVIIFNGKGTPKYYLKVVGAAYVGYLILAVVVLVINTQFYPESINFAQIESLPEKFNISLLGKSAEYWVLTLVAYGVAIREQFSPVKALLCALSPSFLFLVGNSIAGLI